MTEGTKEVEVISLVDNLIPFLEIESGVHRERIKDTFDETGLTELMEDLPLKYAVANLFPRKEHKELKEMLLEPEYLEDISSDPEDMNYYWREVLTAWVQLSRS